MSRVLIVGVGLVGRQLAGRLRAAGDIVVGTTTTPAKVEALQEICDEVHVLRGGDADAMATAAAGCDAVVVLAGPDARRAMSAEERESSYREVLVDTATTVVAAAPADAHLIAVSSLTVYGTSADHLDEVTEDAPVTDSVDPSPASFLAAERAYLDAPQTASVLRCADIYGADDPPIETKVGMAHEYLGGSVPFRADALFYRVHVDDVVSAIEVALQQRPDGILNLTHAGVPATNGQLFDAISAKIGKPALVYRDEIAGPSVPISTARLQSLGFDATATHVWTMVDGDVILS